MVRLKVVSDFQKIPYLSFMALRKLSACHYFILEILPVRRKNAGESTGWSG